MIVPHTKFRWGRSYSFWDLLRKRNRDERTDGAHFNIPHYNYVGRGIINNCHPLMIKSLTADKVFGLFHVASLLHSLCIHLGFSLKCCREDIWKIYNTIFKILTFLTIAYTVVYFLQLPPEFIFSARYQTRRLLEKGFPMLKTQRLFFSELSYPAIIGSPGGY